MTTSAQQKRDLRTLEAMGSLYCRAHHSSAEKDDAGLCSHCRAAIEYTFNKTLSCPYGHSGNCEDCSIKCNRGTHQEDIQAIMRYAAPRMFVRHPVMAAQYVRKKLFSSRTS